MRPMKYGDNNNERSVNTQEEQKHETRTSRTSATATRRTRTSRTTTRRIRTRPTTTELELENEKRKRRTRMKNMKHETPLSGTAMIGQQRSSLATIARRKLQINL
jgi:hypothetical protein